MNSYPVDFQLGIDPRGLQQVFTNPISEQINQFTANLLQSELGEQFGPFHLHNSGLVGTGQQALGPVGDPLGGDSVGDRRLGSQRRRARQQSLQNRDKLALPARRVPADVLATPLGLGLASILGHRRGKVSFWHFPN